MISNPFLNSERQLRNGWWILIFFLVLASLLMPTLITAQQNNMEVSIGLQAMIMTLASIVCQLLRRKPLAELLGKLNILDHSTFTGLKYHRTDGQFRRSAPLQHFDMRLLFESQRLVPTPKNRR